MSAPDAAPGRLRIEARPYDDPDVIGMVAAVQQEYVRIYGAPDAAQVDTTEFAGSRGVLFVGTLGGAAVAMGGWRRLPQLGPDVAELKRMYVDPAVRGQGISRSMLTAAEDSARRAGIRRFVLNTGPRQHAAVALYASAGYRDVTPFGHYADHGGALFLGKDLGPGEDQCGPAPW